MITNNLKHYREKRGLTQDQLALLSGTSKATISNLEKERHFPNQELIKNISKALGLRPCIIFDLGCDKFHCKQSV